MGISEWMKTPTNYGQSTKRDDLGSFLQYAGSTLSGKPGVAQHVMDKFTLSRQMAYEDEQRRIALEQQQAQQQARAGAAAAGKARQEEARAAEWQSIFGQRQQNTPQQVSGPLSFGAGTPTPQQGLAGNIQEQGLTVGMRPSGPTTEHMENWGGQRGGLPVEGNRNAPPQMNGAPQGGLTFGAPKPQSNNITDEQMQRVIMAQNLDPKRVKQIKALYEFQQGMNEQPDYSGNVPLGYQFADPNNPRAGVKKIPGLPGEQTKPRGTTKLADGRLYWTDSLEDGTPELVNPGMEMPGAEPNAAEQKITRIMETLGTDRATAVAIVDGVVKTTIDPVTRQVTLTDLRTGRLWEGVGGGQPPEAQPSAPIQPPRVDFDEPFANTEDAFGAKGFIQGIANTVAGAVGAGVPFPETMETQNDFAVLKESLLNNIASGYKRQPPAWLLKNIEKLVPEAGKFWSGTADARNKLESIGRDLEREYNSTERQIGSRVLSPALQLELETRRAGLDNALAQVQQALDSFGAQQGDIPSPANRSEYDALPFGAEYRKDGKVYKKK